MTKITPVLTEKSLADAGEGVYTFYVDKNTTKHRAKLLVGETFDVTVKTVRTINVAGERKKLYTGRHKVVQPRKKVMVTLKKDQKIDLFEQAKK
ncbi:50S ribosomal protein L23 [Patescibacteria group bacterium]